jgi:hypothetical protein
MTVHLKMAINLSNHFILHAVILEQFMNVSISEHVPHIS